MTTMTTLPRLGPRSAGAGVLALWLLAGPPAAAGDLAWVAVSDPGNACDAQSQGCFGSVGAVYRIAQTEVTNTQYAAFLNAVAAADPHGLYNERMASSAGGIERSGKPGSFRYRAVPARADMPVGYVSFHDALRFANWLHNGRPERPQGESTTEDGAYTLTPRGIADNAIRRNPGAKVFLPSEDEWYKAAYYDASASRFFDYPAGSDEETACAAPGDAPNAANCHDVVGDLTPAGSYPASAAPSGTLDQGGNAWEWNETRVFGRGVRGGAFDDLALELAASSRAGLHPSLEMASLGFRVASVPGPDTSTR